MVVYWRFLFHHKRLVGKTIHEGAEIATYRVLQEIYALSQQTEVPND